MVKKVTKKAVKKVSKIEDFDLNQDLVNEVREMSKGFPKEIYSSLQLFIHSYPSLDRVLKGLDLVARPEFITLIAEAKGIVMKVSDTELPKLKKLLAEDNRIFIGGSKVKGVASGYLEGIDGNYIYLSGMGTKLLK